MMGASTPIQWSDSSVNPTMGCDGCELRNPAAGVRKCYAGTLHDRYGGKSKGYSPSFEVLTEWPGRMAEAARWRALTGTARADKPWLDGLPRLIFVSDMSDALSKSVTFEYLEAEIIANVLSPAGRRHHWLWLSKRPQRMAEFSTALGAKGIEWPANLWAGTSITTTATAARVPHLFRGRLEIGFRPRSRRLFAGKTPAKHPKSLISRRPLRVGGPETVRFLSVEPQYKPIDLSDWLPRLDWVIQGGESGRGAVPFHGEWATDLLGQCRSAGTPYFLKQLGAAPHLDGRPLKLRGGHGGEWAEWPEALRVREMPHSVRPN